MSENNYAIVTKLIVANDKSQGWHLIKEVYKDQFKNYSTL